MGRSFDVDDGDGLRLDYALPVVVLACDDVGVAHAFGEEGRSAENVRSMLAMMMEMAMAAIEMTIEMAIVESLRANPEGRGYTSSRARIDAE